MISEVDHAAATGDRGGELRRMISTQRCELIIREECGRERAP